MIEKGKFVAKVGGDARTAKINVEKDSDLEYIERLETIKEKMRKNNMEI